METDIQTAETQVPETPPVVSDSQTDQSGPDSAAQEQPPSTEPIVYDALIRDEGGRIIGGGVYKGATKEELDNKVYSTVKEQHRYIAELKQRERDYERRLRDAESRSAVTTPPEARLQPTAGTPPMFTLDPQLMATLDEDELNNLSKSISQFVGSSVQAAEAKLMAAIEGQRTQLEQEKARQEAEKTISHLNTVAESHPDIFASFAVCEHALTDPSHPDHQRAKNLDDYLTLTNNGFTRQQALDFIVWKSKANGQDKAAAQIGKTVFQTLKERNASVVAGTPPAPPKPVSEMTNEELVEAKLAAADLAMKTIRGQ